MQNGYGDWSTDTQEPTEDGAREDKIEFQLRNVIAGENISTVLMIRVAQGIHLYHHYHLNSLS